jgi:hypothetical protein
LPLQGGFLFSSSLRNSPDKLRDEAFPPYASPEDPWCLILPPVSLNLRSAEKDSLALIDWVVSPDKCSLSGKKRTFSSRCFDPCRQTG